MGRVSNQTYGMASKIDQCGGQGELWENEQGYYWVPAEATLTETAPLEEIDFRPGDFGSGEKLHDLYQQRSDEMIHWPDSSIKDGQARAEIWMELVTGTHPKTLPVANDILAGEADRYNPRVPTSIAMQGKARMAAYLFVHGKTKTSIGSALDVKTDTVTQYISDVKRGER